MTITASCGHTVLSLDDIITCSVADHDKLGYRCVSYMSLCEGCYDHHAEEGYILLDESEENKWLGGCELNKADTQRMIDMIHQEKFNQENALILQVLVKEFFEKYLNRIEESDSGYEFHPITVSCCRAAMLEPLNDLLDRMAKLSGAERKNVYDLK